MNFSEAIKCHNGLLAQKKEKTDAHRQEIGTTISDDEKKMHEIVTTTQRIYKKYVCVRVM